MIDFVFFFFFIVKPLRILKKLLIREKVYEFVGHAGWMREFMELKWGICVVLFTWPRRFCIAIMFALFSILVKQMSLSHVCGLPKFALEEFLIVILKTKAMVVVKWTSSLDSWTIV
ncbi:hypothetical protein Sjap_019488 [Stephania japonica]|uniref:Uncharacterized protein n=1 Tax=Stephania japonica TaxID=461633 RepID=A0AAP0F7S4_9MAGN